MRAQLAERTDGAVAVTLELPDGAVESLGAPDPTEARAELLAATRRFLHQEGHPFGRLTVVEGHREWELAVPVNPAQEPVVLTSAVHPHRNGRPSAPPNEMPTLHARVLQTSWGDYEATLTLPGGQQQTLTGDELDDTRGQVIDAARNYLQTEVGHPGRLRVEDPDGSWLLGVPHDDSDLVHLSGTATPAPVPTPVPPRRATPGRRMAATGAIVLALLAVAGIAEAVQGPSSKPAAHRAAATRRTATTVSVGIPTVTGSVSTSITTPVAHHPPRPTPRPRPRRASHAAAPATANPAATHLSPSPPQAPAPAVLQPRAPATTPRAYQPAAVPAPAPAPNQPQPSQPVAVSQPSQPQPSQPAGPTGFGHVIGKNCNPQCR
jgi:hypothetical protein